MPHTTLGYLFEGKIFKAACQLAARLGGEHRTFLIVFGEDGFASTVMLEHSKDSWHSVKDDLEAVGMSYFFYDPFDVPEYCWIGWHKVEQKVMERLVGAQFEDADFVKHAMAMACAPKLEPPAFPTSWGVMF